MTSRVDRRDRGRLSLIGLLACVYALVSQLGLGAISLPEMSQQAGLDAFEAGLVLCHSGPATPATDPAPIPRHEHDEHSCPLCPLALALASPAVLPSAALVLPEPGDALPLWRVRVPQSRAPRSPRLAAAYPRGPPVLA